MANLKARLLGGWLGHRLLHDSQVTAVRELGPSFRLVTLTGDALRSLPSAAGDKLQVFLPEIGARTYTPFAVDAARGRLDLLAYLHGDGPGATWARALAPGVAVRFLGPSGSLPLASLPGPVALFGDETSFAVARALLDLPGAAAPTVLLEVSSPPDCERARQALALPDGSLLGRRDDEAFYADCAARLARSLPAGGSLVLTGNARSIQRLRTHLRGLPGAPAQRVKPYWAPGKRGLD